MLRVNQDFILEHGNPNRSPNLVLQLALTVALSFLWTGCNTLSQSSAASSSSSSSQATQSGQSISIQSTLPSAGVGVSYHAVLSVTGGLAPYHFAVTQGQLPAGLVLNPDTGSISGSPTQVGSFNFTITVTGNPFGAAGMPHGESLGVAGARAYTVTVGACTNCVTVQVSPADPSVAGGGKLQFAAAVSNTSNSAVTWSASAGTISSSGLFTAPATSSKPITITAISAAQASAQASTAVTVNNTAFTITTSSVPSAVESTPYSASLTASGGQPPYQWSVLSGSLPPGLQLSASSGTLSGSATQVGTFPFIVRGTDAASHTAQQSLSVLVSSDQTCGPPTYNCSRSDLSIVQLPSAPPSVGNLVGANVIVTDPNFGNRIVRITDSNTNPDPTFKNRTFVTTSSGSADDNLWNIDSTLFIVQDTGAVAYPFAFNPSTLQASRLYVSSFASSNGFTLTDSGNWSRINPNFLYTYDGTAINKYDFTDRTTPPSSQLVYDFTSSRNCLPAGFVETWKTKGGISGDDTVFGMAYSSTGGQGSGIYAVVYKVGSGCSVLNTQTGQVGGDWGTKGTIGIPDRWTIHNVKLSKDGNWLIVAPTKCTSSSCSTGPYFWQIGTTNISSCGDGGSCSGHWTEGYAHWVNNDQSPMSNQVIRAFAQANSVGNLTNSFPPGITVPFDQHQSWNNVDPADSAPFLSTTWSTTTPFPAPWYNEIIAVAGDGSGKTWRFAHSFITARSQRFSTEYGIGTVSQDGKFFVFSSDWMGKLGSESGTSSCTIGSNCRGDVFVVELR
jgi:hypothetical protein